MPTATGFLLEGGRIPGEWINGSEVTADSAGTQATEEVVQTVAADVVSGRSYWVVFEFGYSVSVTTDHYFVRIREDSGIGGTTLQGKRLDAATTAIGYPGRVRARFTAPTTESKTFSATFQRTSGTGTITLRADATTPSFMDVYYRSG